jgi:probable rRNA maturation factor
MGRSLETENSPSRAPRMALSVQVNQMGDWPLPEPLLEAGVKAVLAAEGVVEGEVSLTFLGDEEIQSLNSRYLQRDRPTDVIAFALHHPGEPVLGDIYVGYPQTQRQAEELGVGLEEELLRVSIHGTLHILGHDHPEGPERMESPMFQRQEALLAQILSGLSSA